MPNKPELQPTVEPGNPSWLQQFARAVTKFSLRPPGVCRVQYVSGTLALTIQVTNRVGQANSGKWVVMFWRETAGVPVSLTVGSTNAGSILETNPSSDTYFGMTSSDGLLSFTLGVALSSADVVYALCVGEPDSLTIP